MKKRKNKVSFLSQVCLAIFFVILFQFSITPSRAQSGINTAVYLNEVEEYLLTEEYQEALPLLIELLNSGYDNANIQFKTGLCYLNSRSQKDQSIPFFEKAVKDIDQSYVEGSTTGTSAPPRAWLYLGHAYRITNQLEKALDTYEQMMSLMDPNDMKGKETVMHHMESCLFAMERMKKPTNVSFENLGPQINTGLANYNPVLSGDGATLVFTRKLKFYDALYISKWDGFEWSVPENITNQVGSDGDYYPTGLSHDGTRLLLTSFNMFTGDDIYETRFVDGKWSRIEKFEDHLNSAYSENHASYHPDNQSIYFTSNRPGGIGGYDIYFSERGPDGQWLPAKNMGPEINTPYHEQTPFLASNRKYLYFSSQGHKNLGGYDVFLSRGSGNGNWDAPLNLDYPLNTTGDELFFSPYMDEPVFITVLHLDDSHGETDLYKISLLDPLPVAEERKNILHGKVKDISSVVDINQVEIRLIRIDDQYTLTTKPNAAGDFQFEAPKPGWHILSIAGDNLLPVIDTIEIQSSKEPLYREHFLYSSEPGVDTILINGFVDILFAFDSYKLPGEAIPVVEIIREALVMYPDLRVIILGHTDNLGNREYNFGLSGKRAGSVQQYLIEKGIQPGRLMLKSAGPDSPVADNQTREGRTKNRRVSFEVEGEKNIYKLEQPSR